MSDLNLNEERPEMPTFPGEQNNYLTAAYKFGIPAVIALFLVWTFTAKFDAKVDAINNTLVEHSKDMNKSVQFQEEMKQNQIFTNLLLQRMCVNQAKNKEQSDNCFPFRRSREE